MEEIEKMKNIGYYLIGKLIETNSEEMKFTQKGVTYEGKNLGDFEIIVKKI